MVPVTDWGTCREVLTTPTYGLSTAVAPIRSTLPLSLYGDSSNVWLRRGHRRGPRRTNAKSNRSKNSLVEVVINGDLQVPRCQNVIDASSHTDVIRQLLYKGHPLKAI